MDTLSECVRSISNEEYLNIIKESGKKAFIAKHIKPETLVYKHFPDQSRVQKKSKTVEDVTKLTSDI